MRKHSILGMILILLLAGCAPSFEDKQEVVQDSKDKKKRQLFRSIKFRKNIIKQSYRLNHQKHAVWSYPI